MSLSPSYDPRGQVTTKTIPIVMVTFRIGAWAIDSGAPGGNITGSLDSPLIERTTAGSWRWCWGYCALNLWRTGRIGVKGYEAQAPALKIQLQSLEVRGPNPDFEGAFQAAVKGGASALITVTGGLLNRYPKAIADLAIKNRMPSMYERSPFVDAGGLLSYAPNDVDSYRRAATYVDKILKGAKPADLPVEQPIKFEFIINLKAAKQIGLTIPPNVLARADRVIR
jgi:putative ABC transport system substrate-binding protein